MPDLATRVRDVPANDSQDVNRGLGLPPVGALAPGYAVAGRLPSMTSRSLWAWTSPMEINRRIALQRQVLASRVIVRTEGDDVIDCRST